MKSDDNDQGTRVQVTPPQVSEGAPLPENFRYEMETALGADLSSVRIHEGHEATMLGARAFTHQQNIYFAPGEYRPFDRVGHDVVAHEVTHIVQGRAEIPLAEGLVSTESEPSS